MFAAAFVYMMLDKYKPGDAGYSVFLSAFFTGFVLMQAWNMLNARVLGTNKGVFSRLGANRNFIGVLALILVLQFIIVQVVPGDVFRTVRLSGLTWLILAASTSLVLWIGQLFRIKNK